MPGILRENTSIQNISVNYNRASQINKAVFYSEILFQYHHQL